jgi:hypothetical protein
MPRMTFRSTLLALSSVIALMAGAAEASTVATGPPSASSSARAPISFGVRNFVFISRQASGFRKYETRNQPLFKAGEALQFYAEPVNIGWSGRGRSYRFEMRIDVEIRSADGHVLWGRRDYGHLAHEAAVADPNTYITGSVTVKGLPPGLYVLSVRFRDPNNNLTAETETGFGIVEEPRRIDA